MNKYKPEERIAQELQQIAEGFGFHGNALQAAMNMQGTTDDDRAMLHRYMQGSHTPTDRFALQELANKIKSAQ